MYPERIKKWFPGQTLTAERLNSSVNALNWLLGMAADNDADQPNDGATAVSVVPPGGESPPTPNYQNPPADDITALGQPFKFTDDEVKILPPTVYGTSVYVPDTTAGTPYYSIISTDRFGSIQSVSVSSSPPPVRLWDGTNTGQLVVCSGLLKKNDFGEYISVDANAISMPVVPVFIPAGIGEISLLGSRTGNSVPVAGLRAGSGISISRNSDNGSFVIDISATGGISSAEWSETAEEPTISDGVLTLNLADSNKPGGIKSVEFDEDSTEPTISKGEMTIPPSNYNPSDPSVPPNPGYIKSVSVETVDSTKPAASISRGDIKIQIPKTTALFVENVTSVYGATAAPGVDGWIQTLYLEGSYQNGSLQFQRYDRQLMRFSGTTLQIVTQKRYPDEPGSGWLPA